jgi:hypothetical protein
MNSFDRSISLQNLKTNLLERSNEMKMHPVFSKLRSLQYLRKFMTWHVFAVWDFMSLVKRLQHEFTSLNLPWTPPVRPNAARLLNEIVLGEESDQTPTGIHASHFDLYVLAMREVGADSSQIEHFIDLIKAGIGIDLALKMINAPQAIINFVQSTINTAKNGSVTEVLGSFLYGREDAIPQMFKTLLSDWSVPESETPTFVYYLQRHIELDSDSHGPAANNLVTEIVQESEDRLFELYKAGLLAIEQRIEFWNALMLEFK